MNKITAGGCPGHIQWVLIKRFCELTGYTDKAVRRKIEDSKWIEGVLYRRAPDGHIFINPEEFNKWVASNT